MARRRTEEAGAAAVEFALIAVILLTLLIGIIQFGAFFWGYQVASHAAREGARAGAVNPCPAVSPATAISRASNEVPSSLLAAGSPTASTTGSGQPGDEVSVTVTMDVPIDVGLIPGFPTSISKTATARIEYVPGGVC